MPIARIGTRGWHMDFGADSGSGAGVGRCADMGGHAAGLDAGSGEAARREGASGGCVAFCRVVYGGAPHSHATRWAPCRRRRCSTLGASADLSMVYNMPSTSPAHIRFRGGDREATMRRRRRPPAIGGRGGAMGGEGPGGVRRAPYISRPWHSPATGVRARSRTSGPAPPAPCPTGAPGSRKRRRRAGPRWWAKRRRPAERGP